MLKHSLPTDYDNKELLFITGKSFDGECLSDSNLEIKTSYYHMDFEASLYDRECSPSPLLLSLSCPNQTTHLSAASVPLQHKCNEKQTLPTDKQIGLVQHILESNDINVLTYPLHLEIVHLII